MYMYKYVCIYICVHPSRAICQQMRQVKCLLKASRFRKWATSGDFNKARHPEITAWHGVRAHMHLHCSRQMQIDADLWSVILLSLPSNQPELHQCILRSSCESSNLFHCWLATVTYTSGIQLAKMTEPWSINAFMFGNADRAQLTDNSQLANLWWLTLETLGKADELETELETGWNKFHGFFSPGRLEAADVSIIAWVGIRCPSIRQA